MSDLKAIVLASHKARVELLAFKAEHMDVLMEFNRLIAVQNALLNAYDNGVRDEALALAEQMIVKEMEE